VSLEVTGHETDVNPANNNAVIDIQSALPSDLVVESPVSLVVGRTQSVSLQLTASNRGPNASANTQLRIVVPAGLNLATATTSAGSCSIAGGIATCALGTMAANASANVTLGMSATTVGSQVLDIRLSGDGADTNQDQQSVTTIHVTPLADVAVTLTETAGAKNPGASYQYTATVRNNGPDAVVTRAQVLILGATITSSTVAAGICGRTSASISCDLTALASGASVNILFDVTADVVGSVIVDASLTPESTDIDTANNLVRLTTAIVPAPPPPSPGPSSSSSSGGGGGGGRFDWLAALLLGALALSRGWPRVSARR
jgi:hypothetical protein